MFYLCAMRQEDKKKELLNWQQVGTSKCSWKLNVEILWACSNFLKAVKLLFYFILWFKSYWWFVKESLLVYHTASIFFWTKHDFAYLSTSYNIHGPFIEEILFL